MTSTFAFIALWQLGAVPTDMASLAAVVAAVFIEVFRHLFGRVVLVKVAGALAPLDVDTEPPKVLSMHGVLRSICVSIVAVLNESVATAMDHFAGPKAKELFFELAGLHVAADVADEKADLLRALHYMIGSICLSRLVKVAHRR